VKREESISFHASRKLELHRYEKLTGEGFLSTRIRSGMPYFDRAPAARLVSSTWDGNGMGRKFLQYVDF
jgi:hypothetical protein